MLTNEVKKEMKSFNEKMAQLDELNQIIIMSKVDVLFERQMLDEGRKKNQDDLPRTG